MLAVVVSKYVCKSVCGVLPDGMGEAWEAPFMHVGRKRGSATLSRRAKPSGRTCAATPPAQETPGFGKTACTG